MRTCCSQQQCPRVPVLARPALHHPQGSWRIDRCRTVRPVRGRSHLAGRALPLRSRPLPCRSPLCARCWRAAVPPHWLTLGRISRRLHEGRTVPGTAKASCLSQERPHSHHLKHDSGTTEHTHTRSRYSSHTHTHDTIHARLHVKFHPCITVHKSIR